MPHYALSCIQVHGETGKVVATDSHQLLFEGGFDFPRDDDMLIPGSRLLTHRAFRTDESVGTGRAEDVVALSPVVAILVELAKLFVVVEHQLPTTH